MQSKEERGSERRRHRRHAIRAVGTINYGRMLIPCILMNLSRSGAQIRLLDNDNRLQQQAKPTYRQIAAQRGFHDFRPHGFYRPGDFPAPLQTGEAAEISFGTLGPSLLGYGRAKDFSPAAQKELYERIYNPQSALACSNMPRFGHNKFLTVDQIKDLVALLMDPNSPVNK